MQYTSRENSRTYRAPDGYALEDFRLYKLEEKKDSRELLMWSKSDFGGTRYETDRGVLPMTGEKTDHRTWRVKLALEKGEYGFLSPIGHPAPDPTGTQPAQAWIYTFSVH
jgi:hypothetical protein